MDKIPPEVTRYSDQSLSTIHHALQAARRRLVIGLIAYRGIAASEPGADSNDQSGTPSRTQSTVTVRNLSKEIVAIEEGISVDQATGEEYHSVYSSLIQTHLPKLDDIGAIVYDPDRKTVKPGRNLLPMAMAAAITSTTAQILFHNAVADIYSPGGNLRRDSIGD
jgi:hypothetical protein